MSLPMPQTHSHLERGATDKTGKGAICEDDASDHPASLLQIPRVRRSAASSDVAPPETDISKLPPAARDLYERTKYDIINNILRNF